MGGGGRRGVGLWDLKFRYLLFYFANNAFDVLADLQHMSRAALHYNWHV
jgi:hypothetical protein